MSCQTALHCPDQGPTDGPHRQARSLPARRQVCPTSQRLSRRWRTCCSPVREASPTTNARTPAQPGAGRHVVTWQHSYPHAVHSSLPQLPSLLWHRRLANGTGSTHRPPKRHVAAWQLRHCHRHPPLLWHPINNGTDRAARHAAACWLRQYPSLLRHRRPIHPPRR